ncbi:MAG: hypothetical protein VKJ86_01485, partial [Synechococcus sp.]|nr:hypothetical protein [Synechococcus sp.]
LGSLAWAKLELWGETNIKVNQHFSMLRENAVSIRSEPAFKQRLFKLKHALVTDTLAFTAEEEADLENLLITLGVNWTWASL